MHHRPGSCTDPRIQYYRARPRRSASAQDRRDRQRYADCSPGSLNAYYGALHGEPGVFIVEAQSSWNLYLEILVPDLPDAQKNKSVRVELEKDGKRRVIIESIGENYAWKPFFEEFGGTTTSRDLT
jgi:hypothetical protein